MTLKSTSCVLIALLLGITSARATGSEAVARQSIRLEVVPVVEADLSALSDREDPADVDQTATDGREFGENALVVSPEAYGAKITVTSEPGTSVEVSLEAQAGDGSYPRAAIRLTLTDP